MKKVLMFSICTAVLLSIQSCATIFTNGNPKILIEGDVSEPVTIKTDIQEYPNVTLPAYVEVDRHRIDGKRIKIESPNYVYQDIVLQKKIEGWTWGNIFIGGVFGWCIDMATNCVSKPRKSNFELKYQPKAKNGL